MADPDEGMGNAGSSSTVVAVGSKEDSDPEQSPAQESNLDVILAYTFRGLVFVMYAATAIALLVESAK
jgi:hypothetical protein